MAQRKSSKATRKTGRPANRAGRGATRESRRPAIPSEPSPEPPVIARPSLPPHELYRHEKRRRADQQRGDVADPLEEARRVFKAMIEAGAGTPRGGRPRKVKPRPEDDDA